MNFITNALKKYNSKLLFTDTGSLVYEMKRKDVDEHFYKDKNLFNFRDCPRDSKFFDSANKKVIGKMKDELNVNLLD